MNFKSLATEEVIKNALGLRMWLYIIVIIDIQNKFILDENWTRAIYIGPANKFSLIFQTDDKETVLRYFNERNMNAVLREKTSIKSLEKMNGGGCPEVSEMKTVGC